MLMSLDFFSVDNRELSADLRQQNNRFPFWKIISDSFMKGTYRGLRQEARRGPT